MSPEPTQRDLDRWKRLLVRAEAAAAAPDAPMGDLTEALGAARKAIVPLPPPTPQHAFIRLHRLGARFVGETAAGRRHLAVELGLLVEDCRALLNRASAEPRRRADIDG